MRFSRIIIFGIIGLLAGYQSLKMINTGKGLDLFSIIFIIISLIGFIAFFKYVAGEPANA